MIPFDFTNDEVESFYIKKCFLKTDSASFETHFPSEILMAWLKHSLARFKSLPSLA